MRSVLRLTAVCLAIIAGAGFASATVYVGELNARYADVDGGFVPSAAKLRGRWQVIGRPEPGSELLPRIRFKGRLRCSGLSCPTKGAGRVELIIGCEVRPGGGNHCDTEGSGLIAYRDGTACGVEDFSAAIITPEHGRTAVADPREGTLLNVPFDCGDLYGHVELERKR